MTNITFNFDVLYCFMKKIHLVQFMQITKIMDTLFIETHLKKYYSLILDIIKNNLY